MTHVEYALYHRIFDDIVELRRSFEQTASIQLFGPVAGAALRVWASARRLDVVPSIGGPVPSLGSWTKLQVTLADDISWCITVHLNDYLRLDAPVAEPEMEIPF